MQFVEGCDFREFNAYLNKLGMYKGNGELDRLRNNLESARWNLIVFRENGEIIGHAIWHETNTEEHTKGYPREKRDKEILHGFMGKGRDFVELHELWLIKEHRGKGYGKQFFGFFENYIGKKGYDSIVYYAFDPAAVAICRKRNYKEAYGIEEAGPYGEMETMYTFYLKLRRN